MAGSLIAVYGVICSMIVIYVDSNYSSMEIEELEKEIEEAEKEEEQEI